MEELVAFERYMAHLSEGLGHVDRHAGLRGYCTGLLLPQKRKSVEPMASYLAPDATRSRHQSLHHFVADSAWSDEQMLNCWLPRSFTIHRTVPATVCDRVTSTADGAMRNGIAFGLGLLF